MMKRFFILPILIFCLITNSVVLANGNLSTEQKIEELQRLGIVHGYEDGNFYSERYITRAEFCKMVSIIYGAPDDIGTTVFSYDLPPEHWASKYMSFCYHNDLIDGMSSEKMQLSPDEHITYQDAMKSLVIALGYRVSAENIVLSPDPYPIGYIMVAAQLGLLSGKNAEGTDFMTRADAADIIYDALFIPLLVEREDIGGIAYYPADGEDGRELQTLYAKYFEIKE